MQEAGVQKGQGATKEATAINVIHRGIVNALGVCPNERDPLLIFKYWNGRNLASWLWRCTTDGSVPSPQSLISLGRDANDLPCFKDNIFHIINAILQTIEYLHTNDIFRNDLHTHNIFMHFFEQKNEVDARIEDWGCSTSTNTAMHVAPLQSNDIIKRRETKAKWPQLAPEGLQVHPTTWNKESNFYYVGFVIKVILKVIDIEVSNPKRAFVKHIINFYTNTTNKVPSTRPKAYELVMCMEIARAHAVELDRNSQLQPFE